MGLILFLPRRILLNPIREHVQGHHLVDRVITLQVNAEIVLTPHIPMHHKLHR